MEHMKLTSMKMTKAAKKEDDAPMNAGRPDYPYGLELNLDKHSLKKLGLDIDDLNIGMKLRIEGNANITSLHKSMSEKQNNMSATLQITDLACETTGNTNPKKLKDAYKMKGSHDE